MIRINLERTDGTFNDYTYIYYLVTAGSRLADIGTDHAYIPIYLLEKGTVTEAFAMDVNPGPLRRAEENIRDYTYIY